MLYEPWLETAIDYNDLTSRLVLRGYSNIPEGAKLLLNLDGYSAAPVIETSNCNVRHTMVRKIV